MSVWPNGEKSKSIDDTLNVWVTLHFLLKFQEKYSDKMILFVSIWSECVIVFIVVTG